ncbi:exopolysaccharide transport family protein [Chitinophaga lutea]
MDVTYFIKALLKRKWWILLCTVGAVAAAFVFTMGKPKLYVSTAQMSTGFTTNEQIKLKEENVNLFEADVKFDNVIQTMNSPLVIGLLSCDLLIHDLTSDKPFTQLSEKTIEGIPGRTIDKEKALRICRGKLDSLTMLSSYLPDERLVMEYLKAYQYDYEAIRKMLYVGRLYRTDYIDISYRSQNPELSAFVVNELYQQFIRFNRSSRSERSVENVETFKLLVEQKKQELDQKVEALRGYKSSEGILNVEAASGNEWDLIKQFEKALYDERANKNILEASLASIDEQLSNAGSGKTAYAPNNNEIVQLRKDINATNDEYMRTGSSDPVLEEKLKGLRAKLTKSLVSSSTATGRTTSRDELTARKSSIQGEINAAQQNIGNLEGKIRRLRFTVGSYADKEATVSSLQQEVTLAQEEYNKLKERLNSALDNRSVQQDSFRQTLKGQPAFKPESSKRTIMMGMAGMSVFILSTMIILVGEFMDRSVKSPSIFARTIDLKLICTINHAELSKYSIFDVLQKNTESNDQLKARQNTFRELMRKLRFEVEHSNRKIFLFTSTKPQQGKTTLTQALAYSLSLSNKKVLVLDTNFCNNDITVQMAAKPTLETFSAPPSEFSYEKIVPLITRYEAENIEVIGCKGGDYTPSEILPADHLLNYLPQLKEHYDFILMEGAPLNDYTDSKELSQYAEGVIAVFNSHASINQTDRDSIQFLHELGDKFIGAVLNNVKDDYLEL